MVFRFIEVTGSSLAVSCGMVAHAARIVELIAISKKGIKFLVFIVLLFENDDN
jgi:hypothetical protein